MALSATLQAIYDRLKSFYNGSAYNAVSNPGGFARGGNQQNASNSAGNFIAAMRDFADFGKAAAEAGQFAVDNYNAMQGFAQTATTKAGEAAASAQAAAATAASVNGPAIAARFDAVEGRTATLETNFPSRARITARTIALTGAR